MTIKELDRLAKKIFDECEKDGEPVTMEEAMDMARMELKAKDVKNYTVSAEKTTEKKRNPPKKVVSAEKQTLFKEISEFLLTKYGENAIIVKENKEMNIKINDKSFKIDVVEHRKGK